MKLRQQLLPALFFGFLSISQINAATVTLKDGQNFTGQIKSQDSETLILDAKGIEMRLPVSSIAFIDMSDNSLKAADKPAEKTTTAADSSTPAAVNAGTALTVRMSESVNSRHNKSGQRFTAILETNLMAGDVIAAPKGAKVYGLLTDVKKAGRIAGSASMTMQLTGISVNDVMVDIKTQSISGEGINTARTTAARTARTAAVGGLIDGSDGAKTGAKVGLGLAVLTKGNDIQMPKDELIDFVLAAPLNI
ncbi:hypothetical protein [Psychromonas aquimarina]|uniref:hypothetical protein n=1 Tax=Psychromonas aquimarina TaxID=444919 RepID=UPI000422F20D|nr:hypothetical protein [Psychromonas aquimarina]